MKILLKILVAPFALALTLLAALLVFLFDICAVLLTITSVILAVLGVALFFTPTPIGGIVFLFLAFLLSPYGLQAAAGSLLWGDRPPWVPWFQNDGQHTKAGIHYP